MILSILTPTIPGREKQLKSLQASIEEQIGNHAVEHLILSDNRKRSIGAKRQALLDMSRGQYIAFVDDDDDIADTYVEELLKAAASGADVITFLQGATYNGQHSMVNFQLGQGDHAYQPGGITKRDAWHVNAWRRSRVAHCQFGETNYGEDLIWCEQARRMAQTTVHIPEVLHFYQHDASTTAAPEPNVKGHASPEHTPKIDQTASSASHVPPCSLSSCYSLEQHDGGVILMSMEGNEIILNAEDTRNLGKHLMAITNQDR